MTKRWEASTRKAGADETGDDMNLNELKALVDTAEKLAAAKGIAARDYPVYIIQKSGNISDISTWSPADFNRGGVAFIIR